MYSHRRPIRAQKLGIREHIKQLGLNYTFIHVGWWMQLYLPLPLRSKASAGVLKMSRNIYGAGDDKNMVTDLNNIGTWVARIIADPRTINKLVQIWEDEVTQIEAREIGERVSGDGEQLRAQRAYVNAISPAKSLDVWC